MFTVSNHHHSVCVPFWQGESPTQPASSEELLLCSTEHRKDVSLTTTIMVALNPGSTDIYPTRSHNRHVLLPNPPPVSLTTISLSSLEWTLDLVFAHAIVKKRFWFKYSKVCVIQLFFVLVYLTDSVIEGLQKRSAHSISDCAESSGVCSYFIILRLSGYGWVFACQSEYYWKAYVHCADISSMITCVGC